MAPKKTIKKKVVEMEIKPETEAYCGACEKKKTPIVPIVIMSLVVALAAFGYYRYWNVAEVNGKGISRLEYIKTLEQQGGKQVLDGMIQEAMIMQAAEKQGFKVETSYVDGEIAKIEEQIKTQGATLEEALKSQNMTRDDLVRQITLKKIVTELSKTNQEITAEQIKAFIDENKDQLPPKATQQEKEQIAREQIGLNAENTAITKWLDELKKNSQVTYR